LPANTVRVFDPNQPDLFEQAPRDGLSDEPIVVFVETIRKQVDYEPFDIDSEAQAPGRALPTTRA
jgi:hypothetical protein